ncbi:MAG: hypothetical protein WEC59_13765 [Salibacteraceae bacterium]
MKFKFLSAALLILAFNSCERAHELNNPNPTDLEIKPNETLPEFSKTFSAAELMQRYGSDNSTTAVWPKWKISFTWGGGNINDNCGGGAHCGSCTGLCIERAASEVYQDITQSERADGYGLVDLEYDNTTNTFLFKPDRDMDNGDGRVRIDSIWDLGSEVSSHYGLSSAHVKGGIYTISNSTNEPFGTIVLQLE